MLTVLLFCIPCAADRVASNSCKIRFSFAGQISRNTRFLFTGHHVATVPLYLRETYVLTFPQSRGDNLVAGGGGGGRGVAGGGLRETYLLTFPNLAGITWEGGVGGGGWGGRQLWYGRANISKPVPFIYLAFEKKPGPIHILDHPKCWPIHILSFDFYTHLLLVVRQISQSIHWIPREQAV